MTAQIIEISGQKLAMLPIAEYERLLEIAEEQDDLAAADRAAKRRAEGEEYVPFALIESIINGENALRAWRNYRGLTVEELASRTGARKAMISEIENGKAQGKPALWRALADTLKVTVDDILPLD